MTWINLTDSNQLQELISISKTESNANSVYLIFKHSTRCSISTMALSRLESKWENTINIKPYYLDLLEYRTISNEISSVFNVEHASPQILLIRNGECFYHNSHNGINMRDILDAVITR